MFEEKMSETIETGAPSIKYNRGDIRMGGAEGDEQSKQIAAQIWEQMEPQQKVQFQGFEQFYKSGIWKKILQQMQMDQQQEAGQGIASQMPRGMMEEQVSMSERVPANMGRFMDESVTMDEKIKFAPEWSKDATTVPGGIETIKEKETMKMAGGGARGWKAQMLAEDWAWDRYGREFYDLSQALQMELYGEALDFIDSGGD